MSEDRTPSGEPIDTRPLWLSFGADGGAAIRADLTKFSAGMRALQVAAVASRKKGTS